jgi:hypothetical protein
MNSIKYQNYYNYKIPVSTNILDYGTILFSKNDITIVKASINSMFIIEKYVENEIVFHKVKYYRKNLSFIFEFTDKLTNDHETFIRTLNHYTYEFSSQVLIKKSLNK